MDNNLSIGTRVRHPQYGDGIILDNTKAFYNVVFPNFGEKGIDKNIIADTSGFSMTEIETLAQQIESEQSEF